MPTTFVDTTRSAAAAVEYGDKGRGEKRKQHMADDTTRAVWWSDSFGDREVFVRYCQMSKAKSDGVEALIFRFSWPADELPPDDTTSYDAAGYFIQAFAEENMPGHPYDIVVHIDGESGLVHGHLVAANRSLDDDTLLTTKKQVTRWQMVAAASDKMARERGMRVVEGKRPGWEVEREKLQAKYDEQKAQLAEGEVPKAGGVQVKTQQSLILGDALHEVWTTGDFTTHAEWIARCEEAGIGVKLADDGKGVTYSMKMRDDSGKERVRRRKASNLSSDFTYDGIEQRIAGLRSLRMTQVLDGERELAEERERERMEALQERMDAVEREQDEARERHVVPDLAAEFERRWDDEKHVRVGMVDVLHAVDEVSGVIDDAADAGADGRIVAEMRAGIDEVAYGEMPRSRRNARHVLVAEDMASGLTSDARVELDGIRQMRYRHALRDETAAQEALAKLRDREAKAADAEAKADNARGFIRHTIAYGVLMYRWFQVGMARYDLMREIGAAGEPLAGDEFGGVRDMVADGIAQMEYQAKFRDLAGVDVIDDVQLFRVDKELDELA